MQREVILIGPGLASLLNVRHGMDLDHTVIDDLVHILLRSDVKLEDLSLACAHNELALSPSQPRSDGAGVIARVGSQHTPNRTILVRLVLKTKKMK